MAQTGLIALIIVLVVAHGVSAKRGCSAFGHSCFGGHGKRSGDASPMNQVQNPGDLSFRRQLGQEETPPHPGYPNSFDRILSPADNIIPIRDGGAYEHDDTAAMKDMTKMKLRSIIKHWMENYRRTQLDGDDGYIIETL